MNSSESGKPNRSNTLLSRLQKAKPEFKAYKFNLATDLHERLERLSETAGLSQDQLNDALNYAVRKLVTQLERETKEVQK